MKDCRILKLIRGLVYTSCPKVITYSPSQDTMTINPIISQLPIEIVEGDKSINLISHNFFQIIDSCSGTSQQDYFEGDSFHHTVKFGNHYISIDEVSLNVWNVKGP